MLSSMETPLGLTVVSPQGQTIRLQRSHPAFQSGRDVIRQSIPAEQMWQKLQELLLNPLQVLVAWCARHGMHLADEGETLRLQDQTLLRAHWLKLFQRLQATGGSPQVLLALQRMQSAAGAFDVGDVCLHWKPATGKAGIVQLLPIPAEARIGDQVVGLPSGSHFGLVSYTSFNVGQDQTLEFTLGEIVASSSDRTLLADILTEPVILGHDRTYRCEEGSPKGWAEDVSFDSLKAARRTAVEIQRTGAEARIINCITGEPVSIA